MNEDRDAHSGRFLSTARRAIEQVLARGLNDPRVRGLISVTDTRLSNDRKQLTVLVSIYPEQHQELTMHGLRAATAHVRKLAMERVRSREFPRLSFELDRGLKNQAAISDLLARARDESGGSAGETSAGDAKDVAGETMDGPSTDW